MTTDRPVHRPIIDVLYVEECPNYPDTLALVQRVGTELGIDVELRTTLIADQAAAEGARFPGSPTVRVDGRDVEPGSEPATGHIVAGDAAKMAASAQSKSLMTSLKGMLAKQPAKAAA